MNKTLTDLIRTDCVQPPARPIAPGYRPPMSEAYRLRDGDSWASVARAHDIAAWDLIVFNFPGLSSNLAVAAKEVNWYLQQFVGCRKTTPDRRNYLFHGSAAPGVIYVPMTVKNHEWSVNAPSNNFDTDEDLADVEGDHLLYSHQAGNRWR